MGTAEDYDDFDLVSMQIAEPVFGMQLGQGVLRTHPRSACEGRDIPCCIHSPSDHHMRTWEMNWRADKGLMERQCPHGVWHPDPDHMAYVESLTPDHECIYDRKEQNPVSFEEWMDLDDQDYCPFPHLEWQWIHGCCARRCCVPGQGRADGLDD